MNDFLMNYLSGIIDVPFRIRTDGGDHQIGTGTPQFTITLRGSLSKKDLLTSTSLALGEAYMRGDIQVDRDLYEVLNLFLGNMGRFTTDQGALKKLIFSSRSKKNQQKEVSSHYDIGNDFYSLWLDETLSYSCAYFKQEDDSLYQAQVNKADHILDKLQLREGMTLLDVGCGWGFLLRRAAQTRGVKGLGITLSREQRDKFAADIEREGLGGQLSVELMDYRDLKNSGLTFDRAVSVGMLEHVGRGSYGEYLDSVHSVLAPGGLFLLHYISALKEHPGDAWMKKYIFPGGTVPSLREIINLMADFSFYTLDVESLRRHYNKTLLCWRKNFFEHWDEICSVKGEEFARMWDLYLAACAATFNNGIIDLHQILMSKGVNNDLPMTRVV